MKKIISILFILCFLNGNFVIAQKFIPKKLPSVRTTVRVPDVRTRIPDVRTRVPDVRTRVPDVRTRVPDVRTRVPDVRTHVRPRLPDVSSMPFGISESASTPSKLIRIDMENRGFIHEMHLSSPSEKPSSTVENNNEPIHSPSSINIHATPPKVKMDKLRMKVMKFQNRLNKNEMKTDEFIFIGLLINQNEYGEYYVTNYAA